MRIDALPRSRWLWYLGIVLACVPAAVILALILRYGVDLPFYDQWVVEAPLFAKVWGHQWTFADFWAQHDEHRMAFPRVLYVVLAWWTHWNVRAELVATWALVCLISVAIYRCQRSTVGVGSPARLLQFLLVNVLLFSPTPFETWLWAINLMHVLQLACTVCCLALACSDAPFGLKIGVGALLATIATFSTINGLLCWLLPVPLLFLPTDAARRRSGWSGGVIWAIAFALTTAAYFHGYEKPREHPSLTAALMNPLGATQFLLIYLGNLLAPLRHPRYALIAEFFGGLLLVLYVGASSYVLGRRRNRWLWNRAVVWMLLGLVAVLNGMAMTFSRLGFGLMAASWSRYASYSVFLPIALLFLLPLVAFDLTDNPRRSQTRPVLSVVLVVLLVVLFVFDLFKASEAVAIMRLMRVKRLQGKAALLYVDTFRDETIRTYVTRSDADIRPIAHVMSALGLLHPPLLETARMQDIERNRSPITSSSGALDRVTTLENDALSVSGWTFDPRTRMPADAVILSYDAPNGDAIAFAVAEMTLEPAETPPGSGLNGAAWHADLSAERLPTGTWRLCAWALDIGRLAASRLAGCREVTR